MSDTCETVTIETENGSVDINKSDFDPKTHKLAGAEKSDAPSTVAELKAALDDLGVAYEAGDKKPALKALYDEAIEAD